MSCIGNFIWIIFGGLGGAISFALTGILWCITIIGIPFGLQAFKLANLVLAPFGKKVEGNFGKHPIANLIWFIFGGFAMAIGYALVGLLFCLTIIGIPFGKQAFKLARLAAFPFGAKIVVAAAAKAE